MLDDLDKKVSEIFYTISRSFWLTMLTVISVIALVVILFPAPKNADNVLYEYRVALVPNPEPLKQPELGKMVVINYVWAGQYRIDRNHPWLTAVYAPSEEEAMVEIDKIMKNELTAKQTSERVFKAKIVQVDAIRVEKVYNLNN